MKRSRDHISTSNTIGGDRLSRAFSLLELMVVIMIIMVLSTMAAGIYHGQVERARITRAKVQIQSLSLAINHYFIDVGEYPVSSTGSQLAPAALNPTAPFVGCGYMQLAILRNMNGYPMEPLDNRWKGPYDEFDTDQLGTLNGDPITAATALPQIQILDPWGTPFHYVRSGPVDPIINTPIDYWTFGGTLIPSNFPFSATETFFNYSTFQLVSFGPNMMSLAHPQVGLDDDDITNY